MSLLSYHPGLLKAACKLVSENSFLISATNLIMVTLGNGSMRSWVIALNFTIKGQVQLIFNPLTVAAAAASHTPATSCVSTKAQVGVQRSGISQAGLCFWDFSGKKREECLNSQFVLR